jgi:putative membrane protein
MIGKNNFMIEQKESNQININTELAKERTHGAYDRTMMAWVRTALALIGFGIGIFEFANKSSGETIFKSSEIVGLLLIILGMISMVLAIQENKTNHESLLNPNFKYVHKTSLGVKIGYALIGIGVIALINIIIKIAGQ